MITKIMKRAHWFNNDQWMHSKSNKKMYLLKHCDILGEKTQQEDMKCLHEDHAASMSHLHLHSIQHWDFQLQPVIKKNKKIKTSNVLGSKGKFSNKKSSIQLIVFST